MSGAGVVDGSRHAVLVTLPAVQAKQLQSLARSATAEMKRQGGYLHARAPERTAAAVPSGQPLHADRLAGAWSGELTYFPAPATLEVTLRFDGDDCQGEAAIHVPDRNQRYDAPLASCTIAADTLTFSMATLPLPFLTDRFAGRLVDGRLVGTVERTGRELTNSMSGTWALRRKQPLQSPARMRE